MDMHRLAPSEGHGHGHDLGLTGRLCQTASYRSLRHVVRCGGSNSCTSNLHMHLCCSEHVKVRDCMYLPSGSSTVTISTESLNRKPEAVNSPILVEAPTSRWIFQLMIKIIITLSISLLCFVSFRGLTLRPPYKSATLLSWMKMGYHHH